MSTPSAHIIVDANIARSAKDPARHSTSESCLRFVLTLLRPDCNTGAAMTPLLQAEWKKHASPYMTNWLAKMESRGKVRREPDKPVADLRKAISKIADKGVRAAMLKDAHLSEAAILRAIAVASRDDKQRKFLISIAQNYSLAGGVRWVNPELDSGWENWLMHGCQGDEFKCVSI